MTYFTDLQIKRRSIYALGKDLELSNQELIETIQGAVLNTPTAFNSQTSRVVILLNEESDAFWNEIAYSELEKVTPAEAFEATKERLAGFAQAKGTILFYEDQDVVKGLQEQFPLYAENFPIWSEQGHGIHLLMLNWLKNTTSHLTGNSVPKHHLVKSLHQQEIKTSKQKVVSKFLATNNHFNLVSQLGSRLHTD